MGVEKIFEIKGNEDRIKELTRLAKQKNLVPFLGAGFSAPACPTWADFLDRFFEGLKGEFLLPEHETHYRQLKNSGEDNRFETMADFLLQKSGRRKFEEEMKTHFEKSLLKEMEGKFALLHRVFPGLKITTNFDCLIENNAAGSHVKVCYGNRPEDLEQKFTQIQQNTLLKIHGGLRDIHSIVLSSSQYEEMYGHPAGFDPKAPLPGFLKRVFTGSSVLFIGCSLVKDRIIMIMESLRHMKRHFAIIPRPGKQEEVVALNLKLSEANITPIWITDFNQIEEILEMLAEPEVVKPEPPKLDHGVPFVGREKELEQIRENLEKDRSSCTGSVQMITGRLFNIDGAGGVGKTTLAIEAARRFSSLFKDGVLGPIRVHEHTPMSFALHLAEQLKVKVNEPLDVETAQRLVTALLKDRDVLVILDNAVKWQNLKYMLPDETCGAILVTTRSREMHNRIRLRFRGMELHEIGLEKFTPGEALALFKEMLGNGYREDEKDMYLEIARNLGFLPIALRQAVSLMLFGPRYTASRLWQKLEDEDRLEILRKGRAALETDELTIESTFDLASPLLTPELIVTLEYLAVCSPGPVPLDFLQRLSGSDEIDERLEQLFAFSWCERREVDGNRAYELHQLVRELVQRRFGKGFKEDFIQLVHEIFTDESVHFSIKDRYYLQLEEAFLLAKESKDKRLIDWLYDLFNFCRYRGYGDFYLRLAKGVEELFPGDKWALGIVNGNRALIFMDWGKLDESMRLLKKVEAIMEELEERTEVAKAYANQALILKAWGKLDEAMALHKKQEAIHEELGDRAGLARSFGNQALILNAWGKLDEAMALHKKEEKIKEELGDRAGLATCFGNQAVIHQTQGRLDEAMALHKKEEKLCEELGNRAGLAACLGNQALILKACGKLDEAMALNEKTLKILEELGDQATMAILLWNQGEIYNKKGDYKTQAQLWQKSIQMNKSIGIPTGEDEKALAELKKKKIR